MAANTNLPNSTGSGDLDNIAVTRAEFRAEIGILLEYLAQALGDVGGDYTNEDVKPTEVKLQGTPTIDVLSNPATDNADQRIPSTRWVKESGTYVNDSVYGAPVDGQLWVDTSTNPYGLKVYNSGETDWDLVSGFPSGTRMLFQQEAAPVGWTKDISNDNMALRVTTGTPAIVSGNQGFTTVFTSVPVAGNVGDTILTVDQMPSHSHGVSDDGHGHGVNDPGHSHSYQRPGYKLSMNDRQSTQVSEFEYGQNTSHQGTGISIQGNGANIGIQNNGADDAHNHPFAGTNIDLSINYVDVIVAEKD